MNAEPDLARVARTIGDPTRVRMLTLLMEGRALTAKELAYGTGVEPATGTAHLRRLLADALVVARPQGRHKYFRLASPQVAHCLEALMAVAPRTDPAPVEKMAPLHRARFCYDHLAGRVATAITHFLFAKKLLRADGKDVAVTKNGAQWLADFGVDLPAAVRSRRRFAYLCLDWTERQDHLGGALAAALAQRMIDADWLRRKPDTREVSATALGRRELLSRFDIPWA
jgi:DNA-binding transcriptional ArsR family regulator